MIFLNGTKSSKVADRLSTKSFKHIWFLRYRSIKHNIQIRIVRSLWTLFHSENLAKRVTIVWECNANDVRNERIFGVVFSQSFQKSDVDMFLIDRCMCEHQNVFSPILVTESEYRYSNNFPMSGWTWRNAFIPWTDSVNHICTIDMLSVS